MADSNPDPNIHTYNAPVVTQYYAALDYLTPCERLLFDACLAAKQPAVIDNTNPTPADRARYIAPARALGFSVVGYYFQSRVEECKQRNMQRPPERMVPLAGLLGTYSRLVRPTRQEGFDQLFYVRIDTDGQFKIEEWSDEV